MGGTNTRRQTSEARERANEITETRSDIGEREDENKYSLVTQQLAIAVSLYNCFLLKASRGSPMVASNPKSSHKKFSLCAFFAPEIEHSVES